MRVLLVDDDFDFLWPTKSHFEQRGAVVDTARSVAEAMKLGIRRHYDLFVLDLFLTDGTSTSLSSFFRMRTPEVPILSVTGYGVFANGEHHEVLNTDYLVRKPIAPSELVAIAFHLAGTHVVRQVDTAAS